MLIHKNNVTDSFVYKWYDEETWHHLIDQVRTRTIREDLEFDYLPSDNDLIGYIKTVMDDDTDLYIIPASQVEWSPIKVWYFIY